MHTMSTRLRQGLTSSSSSSHSSRSLRLRRDVDVGGVHFTHRIIIRICKSSGCQGPTLDHISGSP
jgi:hypothetical protein